MKREQYYFATLRYVHDIAAQEFFSVGVAVYAPASGFLKFEFRRNLGVAGEILSRDTVSGFRALMRVVMRRGKQVFDAHDSVLFSDQPTKLDDLLLDFFPKDDSALQWSPVGSGLTRDPLATTRTLFERYCSKYDRDRPVARVRDQDVWQNFHKQLVVRRLDRFFSKKEILGSVEKVSFPFAWKNGHWHCFEPISFDLADKEAIRDKAHKLVGEVASIRKSQEKFALYYIATPPKEATLSEAFNNALNLLRDAPHDHISVTEAGAEGPLLDGFSEKIRQHLAT